MAPRLGPINPARLDYNWRAITIELDAPRPGRIERFLRFVGFPPHITRVVVATPALRRAWFVATALAIIVGLAATDATKPRENLFLLLLLAPLLPVMGVALAYGAESDPAHEIALATPLRGLRLVLTRATVVLAFSSGWLGLAALLAPGSSPMAFAWLLPSVGLTSATVALMTVAPPRRAAIIAGSTWMIIVLMVRSGATDPLAAFNGGGQLLMLITAFVGLVVAMIRRDRFDRLELR